jgi:UDP-galactopyranose mutase
MNADHVIVGSGLTGAVIARLLTDAGRSVVVVDRRNHRGGNVHDHMHASGILIHAYGPHYFRTNCDDIWSFVTRFSPFDPYEVCIKSLVDAQHENWPIAASYIRRAVGVGWRPDFQGTPSNSEEASLAVMPRLVYEKFVKGCSEKQWGVPARELSAELARRFDVREDDEPRLCRHRYQGIPALGYAGLMRNMLDGIPVVLDCDYLQHRGALPFRRSLIFTGPIDEFYGFDLGRLRYRGQNREHTYRSDVEFVQPCGQVNFPDPTSGTHIRQLEWKHMMPADSVRRIRGMVLTQETTIDPAPPNDYEYPFTDHANAELYARYRRRADANPKLLVCGRLGEYKYYDMDQAIARAMVLAQRILNVDTTASVRRRSA